MSKPSPARYRTTNWSSYTASLRRRGSLLIWLDKDMSWLAPPDGKPGRPAVFSDAAIQFCLTVKVLFKLPLRQTTGMVASLLKMANLDWTVPDYTTLCRRQKTLAVQIPYRRADGPLNLLVDSTGIKFLGDGEWQARKHGVRGRRQWRKVHLAMDTATSDIRAVEFTPSSDGDSPILPELLGQIPEREEIGTVTADGAYDTRRCHNAIIDRQAIARGLPGSDCQKRDPPRHTALRPGILEALDGIPSPKSHRGENAVPQGLWRTHRRKRPGPPNRRNPNPHRTDKPLLGPRNGRDRPRGLMTAGKGGIMSQA
ncbi:phosphoribosylglycinamide formyltransferase 2 [Profundibacterium mesophilum KAUST100406-0324]|uniref:Phosphoribosylglycinamide formyltransferase 2 n=1 Tax=Profundibacterium mesophilum KAUST100406-0324 TaxID=1037889 RepID=A0A921NNR1_9RHOB|nr:phosphoribosylglycinamide formyltransferase 2 [Profundibacterium mesophilum KAUST100406-0324]